MADELRRKIQLHKKGDKNDQWIPLTAGSCVQLTDYKNDGVTDGAIKNAVDDANGEFDDLNTALMKLENRKPNKEDLADVAFSGDYNDLENLPDIQSVQPDWEEEDTESSSYIQNKPNLHEVATSGDYEDLENKPTIPEVNDSSITLTINGESFTDNSFTLNQSANKTIDIPLPSFMKFITSITSYGDLPSATKSRVGNVYKVASKFTYNTDVLAKVGDLFICANPSTNTYEWIRIPSGDEIYNRVANGVDGLCPALPNDSTKFLNGVGNWAVPVDTNTTYTLSFNNGTLTLTPSEGQAQTFNIPNDDTTYSISFSNGVLTLTPSSGNAQTINIPDTNTTYTIGFSNGVLTLTPSEGQAQTINIPNDNTTYSMSFANGVLTLTPSVGNAQTINIPDTKVTSSANHYTPSTDNSSDINGALASGDSVGAYTPNMNYNVITGVKAKTDGKGHITDLILTKQAIKDTDNSQIDRVIRVDANGDCVNTNSSNKEIGYYNSNDTINELALKSGYNYLFGTSSVNDGNNYSITTYHSPISSLKITNIPSGALETNITFEVTNGFTFELPDGARYVDEIPTWEAGKEYIVSCYKGVFVFGELTIVQSNNN